MALKDDIDIPLVSALGFVTTAIVVCVVIGTEALYYKVEKDFSDKRYETLEATNDKTVNPRLVWASQIEDNKKYAWVNPEKTHAQVPLDVAIKKLAENNGVKPK